MIRCRRAILAGTALAAIVLSPLGSRSFAAAPADSPFRWTGARTSDALPAPPSPRGPDSRSWPAAIGENFSSPMFFDLDGDGTMEVITTDRQSTYVFAAGGTLLPGWPRPGGSDNIPAVADLDEDGAPEILVASPGAPPRIRCFNVDGTAQAGFPVGLPYQNWLNVSAPAVADVDGDGHLDVGAQAEPGVAFFDRLGQPLPGWPYLWSTTQNIVWSAPAVGDLDGDGALEVVVGNNNLYDWSVHVIRADGTAMPGWPQPTNNIFSSAAVGDLDGDGDLEIVIQEGDPTWYGNRMHVWHHDGTYLPGWPRAIAPEWESSRSNPALADVDGDGRIEIVTQTGDGMLHVLAKDGTERAGYPRQLPGGGSVSSVQVIDVDADGSEEFFLTYYAGGQQWIGGWRLDGATLAGFPKVLFTNTQLDAHSSAHFADLEGDGDLDVCVQGQTFGAGLVWVVEVDGSIFDPGTSRADWPKIRRDGRNTGRYPGSAPAAIAEAPPAAALSLRCSPNPARIGERLLLRVPGGHGGRVSLFDAGGRRVGGIRAAGPSLAVPAGALFESAPAPGVYFLRWVEAGSGRSAAARLVLLDP